jgi:hypothetical protein
MMILTPPTSTRVHWIYEDPSGNPESAVRKATV